jgi:hypothetical protein
MDSHRLFIACAVGAAVTFAGCKGGDGGTTDAGTDGPADLDGHILTCEPPEPVVVSGCEANAEGETHLYLIHVFDLPRREPAPNDDIVPGFNVDGCNTRPLGPTGCGQQDWRFDIDQNGVLDGIEEGVDNQLASPFLADVLDIYIPLQSEIDAGKNLVLVEVSGVNDATLMNDTCVEVTLLRGTLPGAATLEHDGDGRLAAGQAFHIDRESPLLVAQGQLTHGRVLLGPVPLTLTLSLEGASIDFPFDPAWMTFTLTESALGVGILGGGADLDTLVSALGAYLATLDVPLEVVRAFLAPLADLEPDENSEVCTAISLALVFEAVSALEAEPPGEQ